MLNNIQSSSLLNNLAGTAQSGSNHNVNNGPSFASVLGSEMQGAGSAPGSTGHGALSSAPSGATSATASAPASGASGTGLSNTEQPAATTSQSAASPPASPNNPPAPDNSSKSAQDGTGTGPGGVSGKTSTTGTQKTGKPSKPGDTDSTDNAAAAATAAALAAVAAGINASSHAAAGNANSAPTTNAVSSGNSGAQFNALVGVGGNTTSAGGKIGVENSRTAGSVDNTTAPVLAESSNFASLAVSAKGQSANGDSEKNNQAGNDAFTQALSKASLLAGKNNETPTTNSSAGSNAAGSLGGSNGINGSNGLTALINPAQAGALTETMKTANQDLSSAQMNAIAPVLTTPASNPENINTSNNITPQVGSSAWDQAIGQKINWMVAGGQQNATLTLNPPNLGPMQIVLSLNNQHANATFIAQQPEVRAALEHAIPKLREMMEQSGIQLGQCNVNSQAQQDHQQQQANSSRSSRSVGGIDRIASSSVIDAAPIQPLATGRSGTGLVDTFV